MCLLQPKARLAALQSTVLQGRCFVTTQSNGVAAVGELFVMLHSDLDLGSRSCITEQHNSMLSRSYFALQCLPPWAHFLLSVHVLTLASGLLYAMAALLVLC